MHDEERRSAASDLARDAAYGLGMKPTADHLSPAERGALLAALAWQAELGVDECIAEMPADRFAEVAAPPIAAKPAPQVSKSAAPTAMASVGNQRPDVIVAARRAAALATTLPELHEAMQAFDGCALKRGAKNTVFADGNPAARVMIIGEAPGAEEDKVGKPFVGRSGQLLDRMLAAIGLSRTSEDPVKAAYITNTIPWRPVGNRDPAPDESEMMWAFLERHIQLAAPEFIVTMGRISASTMMEDTVRITRIHGQWQRPARAQGRPLLPTLHPAYLLRQPAEKAKAWSDLLTLRAALDGTTPPPES